LLTLPKNLNTRLSSTQVFYLTIANIAMFVVKYNAIQNSANVMKLLTIRCQKLIEGAPKYSELFDIICDVCRVAS